MARKIGVRTYYTTAEVADELGLKTSTIASWCRKVREQGRRGWRGLSEGETFRQINNRWYFTEKWLNNYQMGRYTL